MLFRERLKRVAWVRLVVICARVFQNKYSLMARARGLVSYFSDWRRYGRLPANPRFPVRMKDAYPRIHDKTSTTPVGAVYFYQDAWCAGRVFATKPERHYDIGSKAEMVGIISQFVPTTMIDIRPLTLSLPGLSFQKGDILNLPFADRSIASLSSICVLEHIGLGRYGDALDPFGSEKTVRELIRVLAPKGNLFITVPVDAVDLVYFNAHRAFTRATVMELFAELDLVEEKYIYGDRLEDAYVPAKGFGTGLYHFRRV